MKDGLWTAFELFINIFEAFVGMHFVCVFLGEEVQKRHGFIRWLFLSFIMASVTTIFNSFMIYEGVFILVYIAVVFIYSLIFLTGNVIQKAFVSVFTLGAMLSVSSMWTSLVTATVGMEMADLLSEPGLIRFITIFLVQATNLLLFKFLIQVFGKERARLQKLEWLLLLTVFLFSGAVMVCLQIAELREQFSKPVKILFLCVDISIVIINLVTIEMLAILNRRNQERMETERLQMQLQYQTQYATAVQQQEEIIHRLRHDMRHNMTVMKGLVDENNREELTKYLAQYADQLQAMIAFVRTNNVCVDAIINTKLTYAQEKGIGVICRIDANLPALREIDYCTLLGNLLDNAIEASLKNLTQPEIILEMRCENEQLIICVKNRIDTSVLAKNPKLKTSKDKHDAHGFGVRSIREIAERYDGTVDFYEDNSYFIARISLHSPLNQTFTETNCVDT